MYGSTNTATPNSTTAQIGAVDVNPEVHHCPDRDRDPRDEQHEPQQ